MSNQERGVCTAVVIRDVSVQIGPDRADLRCSPSSTREQEGDSKRALMQTIEPKSAMGSQVCS